MLVGVVVIGLTTPGVSADATQMALWMTVGWGVLSAVYLVMNSRKQAKHIIPPVHMMSGQAAGNK